jgi:hypothetical protein
MDHGLRHRCVFYKANASSAASSAAASSSLDAPQPSPQTQPKTTTLPYDNLAKKKPGANDVANAVRTSFLYLIFLLAPAECAALSRA